MCPNVGIFLPPHQSVHKYFTWKTNLGSQHNWKGKFKFKGRELTVFLFIFHFNLNQSKQCELLKYVVWNQDRTIFHVGVFLIIQTLSFSLSSINNCNS